MNANPKIISTTPNIAATVEKAGEIAPLLHLIDYILFIKVYINYLKNFNF